MWVAQNPLYILDERSSILFTSACSAPSTKLPPSNGVDWYDSRRLYSHLTNEYEAAYYAQPLGVPAGDVSTMKHEAGIKPGTVHRARPARQPSNKSETRERRETFETREAGE